VPVSPSSASRAAANPEPSKPISATSTPHEPVANALTVVHHLEAWMPESVAIRQLDQFLHLDY
jgi:hypothetical protein